MGADKLDTVRKLLAKAEGAATVAEAETYTAKAVELMARHGIDAALLAAADPGRDAIGPLRIGMQDPYSAGKARLLGWTAQALGCRWVMHGAWGGKVAAVTVFGHASDRERAEMLYTSLLLQATAQLVRAAAAATWRVGGGLPAFVAARLRRGGAPAAPRRRAAGRRRRHGARRRRAGGRRHVDGARAGRPARPGRPRLRRGVPPPRPGPPDGAHRAPGSPRAPLAGEKADLGRRRVEDPRHRALGA